MDHTPYDSTELLILQVRYKYDSIYSIILYCSRFVCCSGTRYICFMIAESKTSETQVKCTGYAIARLLYHPVALLSVLVLLLYVLVRKYNNDDVRQTSRTDGVRKVRVSAGTRAER